MRTQLALACALMTAWPAPAQDAATLKECHQALRASLVSNAFGRPLAIESVEHESGMRGDAYARIDQPFAVVGPQLQEVERNTMRYYLAIEAFLGALALPPAQRFERRLADWQTGVERYPLQLHELERDEYLELKRRQAAPG